MPCLIERQGTSSRAVFSVAGRFDGSSALELLQKLSTERASRLSVDFARVTEFVDCAVDILASALSGRTVELVGLTQHQERLLRYFGVDVAPRETPALSWEQMDREAPRREVA